MGNELKYGAATGTFAIRWEGARNPLLWIVDRPSITPADARVELARRYLNVFGPATAQRFARWAGIKEPPAVAAFAELELVPCATPLGEEWLLAEDEQVFGAAAGDPPPVRLLPSGDAYWLLDGAERQLLVPNEAQRQQLWTSRVWPGALLVAGEIRGTWRRAQHVLRVSAWSRLSRSVHAAVEAEAATLPLPLDRPVEVVWDDDAAA